jgi:hypothetical protein
MRESYVVGYDPQMKTWSVSAVSADYPHDYWVFKVNGRDRDDALGKALDQFKLLHKPSHETALLMEHILKKSDRHGDGVSNFFVMDIPSKLQAAAQFLVEKSLLLKGYESQILIDKQSPFWKSIQSAACNPKVAEQHTVLEL